MQTTVQTYLIVTGEAQNSDITNESSFPSNLKLKWWKNMNEQFLKNEFSDVKIICDGKTFDCHKYVLLCQSDFFKGNK